MHTEELIKLGLSKNEAQIYEVLVEYTNLGVGEISIKSKIHRRNVYDCMDRLHEKGLVIEVVGTIENRYKAVHPKKLQEIVDEKRTTLEKIMPSLLNKYKSNPKDEEVYIYKGIEGWKTYMTDILSANSDVYTIGGGGLWADTKMKSYFSDFLVKAKKKNIKFYTLYDHEVKKEKRIILDYFQENVRFLDKSYSTEGAIDIFAGTVVIMSKGKSASINDSVLTVIVNPKIADAFRTWFKLIWNSTRE